MAQSGSVGAINALSAAHLSLSTVNLSSNCSRLRSLHCQQTAPAFRPQAFSSHLIQKSSFLAGESLVPHPHSVRRRQRRSGVKRGVRADYYQTLGVSKGASKADIKSAYRRLARQFHPDVNKQAGAEQKFKDISNAYEVLSDDEKRTVYDQYGEAGLKGGGMGGGTAYGADPMSIFEQFFRGAGMGGGMGGMGGMGGFGGMGSRRQAPVRGEDIRYDLKLDFLSAVFGADKEFEAQHLEQCGSCDGSGARGGSSKRTCSTCGGQGQVITTSQTPFGVFQQVSTCPSCSGEGEIISEYCRKCGGEGRVRVKKTIKLKIPAGVQSGSTLRVRGEGNAGPRGGPTGDLYVYLNVQEDPDISREGNDLFSRISISYVEAILGTVVTVKTVEGTKQLQIPAGTQPGDTLMMQKLGVPQLGNARQRGDHYFAVKVGIPTKPSSAELRLIEELAELQKGGGRRRIKATSSSAASTSSAPTSSSSKRTEIDPSFDTEQRSAEVSVEEESSTSSSNEVKEKGQSAKARRTRRKSKVHVTDQTPLGEIEVELVTPFADTPESDTNLEQVEGIVMEEPNSFPLKKRSGFKKVVKGSVTNCKPLGRSVKAGRLRRKKPVLGVGKSEAEQSAS